MVKPRQAASTVRFVDTYCELYKDLFIEVRAYECFKYLHVGLISDLKKKSLPKIAKVVGLENEQGLHHFLTESPWLAKEIEKRRLSIILNVLEAREIDVIIDETGDKKKGKKTDYVKRQYIGNMGKIENGIVSVNAYGHYQGMTFPLKFKIFKPKERLKEGDKSKSKPVLGAEIVKELREMGFQIKRVLADSLYGESSSNFLSVIEDLKIEYAVAIRSNHGVWLPQGQKVRANKWREFEHQRADGQTEKRWIREIIYGRRRLIQYWEITTDKETIPEESTWFVMTKIPKIKYKINRWLKVFPIPQLSLGFPRLIALMNEFDCLRYLVYFWDDFYYSSA